MRHYLFICIAMLGLGLAGTWLSLGHEPPPRLAVGAGEDPTGTTATLPGSPEPEIIAPAGDVRPTVHAPSNAPKVFVPPPSESTPDLTGDLATLEARWQELRRQGHWREAAPYWEKICLLRAEKSKPTGEYTEEELKWVSSPAPGSDSEEPKGGFAPAEPPRMDMLPGPLPGPRSERIPEVGPSAQDPGSIIGQLIDDTGKPVADASVLLRRSVARSPTSVTVATTVSDAMGNFRFGSVMAGSCVLHASCSGHDKVECYIDVEAGIEARPSKALVLTRLARVKLVLVSTGHPVQGRTFALRLFDATGRNWGEVDAVASEDGVLVFQVPHRSVTEFMLCHRRFRPCPKQACELRPGEEFDGGRVHLTPTDDRDE